MKIIKITSLGCMSCLIMNERLKEINEKYNLEVINYDYDFDDVEDFNVGTVLPVIIFLKNNKEVARLVGEHSQKEIEQKYKEVLDNEK